MPEIEMQGKLALVTGGAGFIGSHLSDALLAAGARVRVLDNLSTGYRTNLTHLDDVPEFEFVEGDAADEAVVAASVQDVDVIFHEAAMASVPRSMRQPELCHHWTTTSTVELLKAGQVAGVDRFVLASTSAAYGNSTFVSKRETDPVSPLSPYAASKLASEAYCQAFFQGYGMETVILRYFNVFGPRQDPQSEYSAVIPRFVSMILEGKPPIIYGDGNQSRDFVYVGDVAKANLLAATMPGVAGGVFNVARGERTTLLQLLSTLQDLLQQTITADHQPPRDGDVRDSLADISQARSRLKFEPDVTMESGLRQSIDYYRSVVTA